jgi:hypothetical protein
MRKTVSSWAAAFIVGLLERLSRTSVSERDSPANDPAANTSMTNAT